VTGQYDLFGTYLAYSQAWNHQGTDMLGLVFPEPNNPDYCYRGLTPPCDPATPPLQRDPRCGDSGGVVWKTPLSSVNSWLYQNNVIGGSTRVLPTPSVGGWPRQWPVNCPLTGANGFAPVVSAKAINDAIPSPPHALTPGGCSRDTSDPNSYATGAADPKVVYANGKWYMAFSETINNPDLVHDSWTSGDLFLVLWGVSNDGLNWTIRRQLFRTTHESTDCSGGMLVTQLTVDNNNFYMLVDEIGHAGLLLFRAPINTALPDGFAQWQIATHDPNPNLYHWVNTPANGYIDSAALNAFSIMPGPVFVKQGAMARVHSSSAGGASRIIGVTNRSNDLSTGWLELWSAPDLDTPFTFQNIIDTTFYQPVGLNGWEPAFTVQPNQGPSTPLNIGNEFDFWLIGNFYQTGQNLDGHVRHLTAYRMTTTLSGDIFSPRLSLRSSGGFYLSVTAGTVNISNTSVLVNSRFVIPKQGNSVSSNDSVTLVARNGFYASAPGGGGGAATATPNAAGTNETFTIVRVAGAGVINNGDAVAIRSANGHYLTAPNGGGGTADFSATTINANSTFTYNLAP
jgi:hypothetical protein